MRFLCFCIGLFMLSLLLAPTASAQNINNMNFNTIHVDDLSDDQIRQFMLQVQQTGMTDNQLDQIALSKGLSPSELQKLKARIAQLKIQDSTRLQNYQLNNPQNDTSKVPLTYGAYNDTLTSKVSIMEGALDALRPKVFGEELFKNPNMTFEPNLNLPTPQNYQVGPQDEVVIYIYGYSEANYQLTVSKEGSISVPYIGLVYVNGLTIQEASERIKSKLATVYSGIKTGKTTVQVSIGNIRSIKVTMIGEVTKPGTYTLPSLATIFNALYAAGGPSQNGSYRDIELIRNNQVIEKLDVYDFLMRGDQTKNVRLQDQDVIRIPTYNERVQLLGQVKRPGIYEMQPDETLSDLLKYCGGFSDSAYSSVIKAVRVTGTEKAVSDVAAENFASFHPRNGDKFFVSAIIDKYTNRVIIDGAVYRPGQFELTQGLTLSNLIKKADGLREDAFLPRGYIVRRNPDLTTSTVQFDVAKIMSGEEPDVILQKDDEVHIYSIFDLRDQYAVSIEGSVRSPGEYAYSDSMTLEDLIMQSGGFMEGASPRRIEVSRRQVDSTHAGSATATIAEVFQENVDKDLQLHASRFVLKPFDIVVVRNLPGFEKQKQVSIEGEVMYPGLYTLSQKDERVSDLVKRAGGLTDLAFPQGASLKRTVTLDSSGIARLKMIKFERLQATLQTDSTQLKDLNDLIVHNDFVGIHLDKILKEPDTKSDLFLEGGDILYVPRRLQTVKVNGEVLYPVITPFQSGKAMRYYISQAGGFSGDAKKNRVYVVYANGFVRSTRNFLFIRNYPPLEAGSEVFVPIKPIQNKLTTQEIFGITSGVASLALTVLAILNLLK